MECGKDFCEQCGDCMYCYPEHCEGIDMSEEFYGFGDTDFDTTAVEWLQREYKSYRELWDRHGDVWGYQLSEPILVEMLDAYFNYRLNLDMKETGRKIDEMGNAGCYGD